MKKSLGPCHYWGVAPWRRAVTPGTTVVVVVVVSVLLQRPEENLPMASILYKPNTV